MTTENVIANPDVSDRPMGWLDRLARRAVHAQLARLPEGRLMLEDSLGSVRVTERGGDLSARVTVNNAKFYRRCATGGSLGAAESFLRGEWSCDDMTSLFRIFIRGMDEADRMDRGLARLAGFAARLWHRLRPNTRSGSRRNIHEHYDLGNDFFDLFLDETMSYSCAYFEQPSASLADASRAKLDMVCRKLELQPGDHLLEIGTGWGGLAMHAARHFGCRVTSTTISREQYERAKQRVAEEGLGDRITFLLEDYRDLKGQYDKLVSIEMIEAVGHKFLPTFFSQCARLLKPDGLMLLQAISMPDHRYAQYRRNADFIQRYVFPGSCVPSLSAMTQAIARASDLRVLHLQDIGPHYATTLRHWRHRFVDRLDEVRALGYDERLIRMWLYYLTYCEAGFLERYTGVAQIVLGKPRCLWQGNAPGHRV